MLMIDTMLANVIISEFFVIGKGDKKVQFSSLGILLRGFVKDVLKVRGRGDD